MIIGCIETAENSSLPPGVEEADRVVLFDGVCNLCGAWARFLIRADKKHIFKLAAMQSEEGESILRWHGLPTDQFDSMVLVEGARISTRSAAFLGVMRHLPLPWRLLWVFSALPKVFRDWAYNVIATNRYVLFGRTETCLVPNAEHEQRFLKKTTIEERPPAEAGE